MKSVNSLIEGWVKNKSKEVNPDLSLNRKDFEKAAQVRVTDQRLPHQVEPDDSTKPKKRSTKPKKGSKSSPDPLEAPVQTSEVQTEENDLEEEVKVPSDSDFGRPTVFKCGHTNYKHHGITENSPLQVKARKEGYCCQSLREATLRAWKINPSMAERKRTAQVSVVWQVKGLHEPVPQSMRRSPEKHKGNGWPGLCCDPATGLYIGGLGNNCRHYHDGPERCVVHASKRVIDFSDEE